MKIFRYILSVTIKVFTTPIKSITILGNGVEFGEKKEKSKPEIQLPTPEETKRYGRQYHGPTHDFSERPSVIRILGVIVVLMSIVSVVLLYNEPNPGSRGPDPAMPSISDPRDPNDPDPDEDDEDKDKEAWNRNPRFLD